MKLEILRVEDHGTLESERIFLAVNEDADLRYYIVRDSTFTVSDRMSNKWVHAHQFLPQAVEAGDEVVLYTASAPTTMEKINNGQNTRYNYSWGLNECVWNNDGDLAVLYEIKTWTSKKLSLLKIS